MRKYVLSVIYNLAAIESDWMAESCHLLNVILVIKDQQFMMHSPNISYVSLCAWQTKRILIKARGILSSPRKPIDHAPPKPQIGICALQLKYPKCQGSPHLIRYFDENIYRCTVFT